MGRYSRIIRNICRMLDIEYIDPLVIECPMCEKEAFELKGDDPKARCGKCGLEWKMGELEIVIERDFDHNKRDISDVMNNSTGVCG